MAQCNYWNVNYITFQWFTTVRFTKSDSVLPLYKISVLLKTGGAGVFVITRKIDTVIKGPFERFDR